MRNKLTGSIIAVRDVEDCIRATKKYTKGAFTRAAQHPIQGEDFPSKVLTEYYEVYPDLDLEQVRSLWDTVMATSDWLWGDIPHVDVRFHYNYQTNVASMTVLGGGGVMGLLCDGIPGLTKALAALSKESEIKPKEVRA